MGALFGFIKKVVFVAKGPSLDIQDFTLNSIGGSW